MSDSSSPRRDRRRRAYGVVPAVLALGLGVGLSPASAGGNGATITREDVTGDTVSCGAETLTVTSGTFKVVINERVTPSGALHVTVQGSAQGVKAISSSGAQYLVPGGFSNTFNATRGATVSKNVGVLTIVGQGGAPNFHVHDVVHVTINANGDVTADVDFHRGASCVVPPMG